MAVGESGILPSDPNERGMMVGRKVADGENKVLSLRDGVKYESVVWDNDGDGCEDDNDDEDGVPKRRPYVLFEIENLIRHIFHVKHLDKVREMCWMDARVVRCREGDNKRLLAILEGNEFSVNEKFVNREHTIIHQCRVPTLAVCRTRSRLTYVSERGIAWLVGLGRGVDCKDEDAVGSDDDWAVRINDDEVGCTDKGMGSSTSLLKCKAQYGRSDFRVAAVPAAGKAGRDTQWLSLLHCEVPPL
ncbi:hypothetical protein C8R43DRAFT_943992 [Mycena crocata]|nr:hypothetical protein C8R43DRAFT_943992 [Mycena crocata]